ncbi:MAG: hypothetical protein K6G61_12965 [Solobacterium sp.]|nr:hypothetical protein [Solobacterium sp.]
MNLLIISLKAGLVLSWVLTILGIVNLYRADTGVKMKFDWLSYMNISGTIGLTLVSLFAVIQSSTYIFTVCLIAVTIGMVWFLKTRLMIAGDHKVLLGSRIIDLSDIRGISTKLMTLSVETKNDKMRLYAPVTERSVTMKLYEAGKGKKKK